MSDRPFRVGVVGLGFGSAAHIPAFQGLDGVEVAACAGRRAEKAAEIAARFGIAVACPSVEALLDLDLDAVSLALPPDAAAKAAAAALERGLAVLAEKPLAATLAEAEQLCSLARGRITAVDFQFGELAGFRALAQEIAAASLGAVRRIEVDWRVMSWAQAHGRWSWKTDANRGGGVMTMMGSHVLHLVEWLAGPMRTLEARLDNRRTTAFAPSGASAAEEAAEIRLDGIDGILVEARIGNASEGPPLHRWRVECDGGSLILENTTADYMDGFVLETVSGGIKPTSRTFSPAADGAGGRLDAFRSLAERFVQAARQGRPMKPDFTDGLRVQKLMAAVRDAAECGRRVDV